MALDSSERPFKHGLYITPGAAHIGLRENVRSWKMEFNNV